MLMHTCGYIYLLFSNKIASYTGLMIIGKQHKYKMQLQNYAQSKTLDPPLYSSKSEGPPHALQFQGTVTIDGHSFDSPGHFRTLKEAEHVAARVALMSLSSDSFQEASFKMHLFIVLITNFLPFFFVYCLNVCIDVIYF